VKVLTANCGRKSGYAAPRGNWACIERESARNGASTRGPRPHQIAYQQPPQSLLWRCPEAGVRQRPFRKPHFLHKGVDLALREPQLHGVGDMKVCCCRIGTSGRCHHRCLVPGQLHRLEHARASRAPGQGEYVPGRRCTSGRQAQRGCRVGSAGTGAPASRPSPAALATAAKGITLLGRQRRALYSVCLARSVICPWPDGLVPASQKWRCRFSTALLLARWAWARGPG
jgi:hypothetical protein